MPTDHRRPKLKEFKLFNFIDQSLHQLIDKKPLQIFILLNRKWFVGSAHPTTAK
jgi:hypothetical protein